MGVSVEIEAEAWMAIFASVASLLGGTLSEPHHPMLMWVKIQPLGRCRWRLWRRGVPEGDIKHF
jgi:hypothetical protein